MADEHRFARCCAALVIAAASCVALFVAGERQGIEIMALSGASVAVIFIVFAVAWGVLELGAWIWRLVEGGPHA